MYLFYASAFLKLILDSVVIKIFIYDLYTFISRYVLWYLDNSVVYMRDLILAYIWLLGLCSYKSGVTSATALRAHHPPSCSVASVGCVASIPPHPGPRRRRERRRQRRRTTSRAGKGISVMSFSVLRTWVQESEDPSVNPCVILCELGCWLVKFVGNCRKIQILPN
jgi:hypothetical protein